MTQTIGQEAQARDATGGAGGAARRQRRVSRAWLIAAALVLALTAVVFLGLLYLATRPIELPAWMTERAEERVNAALEGPRVELGGVELRLGASGLPQLVMQNVSVFDARGTPVAQLNRMGARLDRSAMFVGEIRPRRLSLSGAQMTLRRAPDGAIDLSFGGGTATSGPAPGLLESIDEAFAAPPLDSVRRIDADNLTITLEDARSGRVWQVTGGALSLTQNDDRLEMTVSAEIFNGTEDLALADFRLEVERGSPAAGLSVKFENAAAADIAAQTPALAFLSLLDAPISGALETRIDEEGAFSRLEGMLEIGEGAVSPPSGALPLAFGGARAAFAYSPDSQRIDFEELSLSTEEVVVAGAGHAYLREFAGGWPGALVSQFRADTLTIAPKDIFERPVTFSEASMDMRLRLDPLSIDIGALTLMDGPRRFLGSGRIAAEETGWVTAVDLALNRIEPDRLLDYWPVQFAPGTRRWITERLEAATLFDIQAALRGDPGGPPRLSLSYKFEDGVVQYLPTLPPIENASGYASILNETYTMVLETGRVVAPEGGPLDVAGSLMRIPDLAEIPARALFNLRIAGSVPATLSLLDEPPFRLMQKAGRSPDFIEGDADLTAALGFDLIKDLQMEDVDFRVAGTLSDVSSENLAAGRLFTADRLTLEAGPEGLRIAGPAKLGEAEVAGAWTQGFGPEDKGRSRAEGTLVLSRATLDEFNVDLPDGSVAGAAAADFALDLMRGEDARLALTSDLAGLALRIDALGWSLPAAATGRLELDATLGEPAAVPRLAIEAPGLSAEGQVTLEPGGALAEARFDRVRAGGWFDAPVRLIGRGAGVPPQTVIPGGNVDLPAMRAAGGPEPGRGGGQGSAPITVALDRLVVADGITLTEFRGEFRTVNGIEGPFTARINGNSAVSGDIVPAAAGTAYRIRSQDGGRAMKDAGLLKNFRGGAMEVVLSPTGEPGTYEGSLAVRGTRLFEAPALTELLSAISVVGLVDQIAEGGIGLDTVDARFRLSPSLLTVYQASAVGLSLGFSIDGRYDLRTERMDFQGVVSPVYFVNAVGRLLSPRAGEGLFGFNFTLSGPASAPRVTVNPLSILTPGMFREIFRRPPPERVTQ